MGLNVHWHISEQMCMLVSSDEWTRPAWCNWLVFPDVYYAYILVGLVLVCTRDVNKFLGSRFINGVTRSIAVHYVASSHVAKTSRAWGPWEDWRHASPENFWKG